MLAFLNSILLLGQLNQLVVIATGCNSCGYVYDSTSDKNHGSTTGTMPALYSNLLHNLDEFVARDQKLATPHASLGTVPSSLLSGSLSMALCCILLHCFFVFPLIPFYSYMQLALFSIDFGLSMVLNRSRGYVAIVDIAKNYRQMVAIAVAMWFRRL